MYKESVQDRHNLTKKKGIIEYGGGGLWKWKLLYYFYVSLLEERGTLTVKIELAGGLGDDGGDEHHPVCTPHVQLT